MKFLSNLQFDNLTDVQQMALMSSKVAIDMNFENKQQKIMV